MKIFGAMSVAAATVALAGCAGEIPNSARGVGFDNELPTMDQIQSGSAAPTRPVISPEVVGGGPLAAPAGVPGAAGGLPPSIGQAVANAEAGGPAPSLNNPGISDEQNFDAVSSRETIQSDAARRARQQAEYEVIRPEALPARTSANRPNIVAYALSTQHMPGQKLYGRSALRRGNASACSGYASADLAQEAFLQAGGPERDRLGLDPDGDGFACAWDPRPFRRARG